MKGRFHRLALAVILVIATSFLALQGHAPAFAACDASISGTVVDSSGARLSGIDVLVYADGSPWSPAATAQTVDDGSYTVSGLPHSGFHVKFQDNHMGAEHGQAWWHSGASLEYGGDLIDLAASPVRTGVDQTLYFPSELTVAVSCSSCTKSTTEGSYTDMVLSFQGRAPGSTTWSELQELTPAPNNGDVFQMTQPGDYRVLVGYSGTKEYVSRTSVPTTFVESTPVTVPTVTLAHARVLARASSGSLYRYSFSSGTKFSPKVKIGSGFSSYSAVFPVGDFTGDGQPDVMAVTSGGTAYVYPGTSSSGLSARRTVGTQLAGLKYFAYAGDWTGDGNPDVFARSSGGTLYLYPGDGRGGFLERETIGKPGAWKSYTLFRATSGFGSANQWSLLARSTGGTLYLFRGDFTDDGSPTFDPKKTVASGLATAKSVIVSTDLNANGSPDLLVQTSGGSLVAYFASGSGSITSKKTIATGWKVYSSAS